MRSSLVRGVALVALVLIVGATLWYAYTHVHFVTKEERRAVVAGELSKALERYYDEHGRYPTAETNDALATELSEKKYFDTPIRIDVVQYVPINHGQTYELR